MTKPVDKFAAEQEGYKQTLGRRHVQMIAIGGAIGTGLFWDPPPASTAPVPPCCSAMPSSA